MNVVKEIQRINQREIASGAYSDTGSWHAQYKDTAWIFAGNIPFDLTEGDVVCIFSQYGEIIHIELVRDRKTGKSKGFAFLQYEDQRSTILAVDNLNGADVLGRTLRVDHSFGPKKQKRKEGEEESDDDQPKMNVAPEMIEVGGKEKSKPKPVVDVDEEDPMAAYFRDKKEKKSKKKDKSSIHHKHKSSKEKSSRHHRDEDDRSPSERRDRSADDRRRDRSPEERRRDRSPAERRRDRLPDDTRYRDESPARRPYRSSRDRSESPPRRSYRRSRSPRSRSPTRRSRTPPKRSRSPRHSRSPYNRR